MMAAALAQVLNVDSLIAEQPGVGDMLDRLHIAADFGIYRSNGHQSFDRSRRGFCRLCLKRENNPIF
jgi:hypothetical protein